MDRTERAEQARWKSGIKQQGQIPWGLQATVSNGACLPDQTLMQDSDG